MRKASPVSVLRPVLALAWLLSAPAFAAERRARKRSARCAMARPLGAKRVGGVIWRQIEAGGRRGWVNGRFLRE
jgi:hypothetical protein